MSEIEVLPAKYRTSCDFRSQNALKVIFNGFYKNEDDEKIEIKEIQLESIKNTKSFPPNFNYILTENINNECKIELTQEKTITAAIRLFDVEKFESVCALNFANGFFPGGGFLHGANAQEESICKVSSLFSTLIKCKEYYQYHSDIGSELSSDYMIFSPNVPIFFNDDFKPLKKPVLCSFITSAAVNVGGLLTEEIPKVYENMNSRIQKVLELAIHQNCKVLILGAFGCGAFHNNPHDISKIFHFWLIEKNYKRFFNKIVFANYSSSFVKRNYEAFLEIFSKYL